MLEFFRGGKRKVGCVTLVLACLFTVGWMRSFLKVDMVNSPIGDREFSIASIDGKLDFAVVSELDYIPRLSCSTDELKRIRHLWSNPDGSLRGVDPWSNGHEVIWRWDCFDFHFGASKLTNQYEQDWMVPYWSIVLPLAAISAWLILSKPGAKIEPPTTTDSESE
jgi:hypothetical protein